MESAIPDRSVVLVTGGYKNIGYAISKGLKNLGYRVIATYRSDEKKAGETSRELGIEVHKADMSNESDVENLFKHLRSRDLLVGVLVNNVSSFPTGPLENMDPEDFRGAFKSCVFSSFYAINRAIPDMKMIGRGSIINIGMAGVDEVKGYTEVAAHASAKTALAVLTRSYAKELEIYKINVNMVSPGIVDREDRDEDWRKRMRSISIGDDLVTENEVADGVIDLIRNGEISGKIVDIL